jgi:hypothetical protein
MLTFKQFFDESIINDEIMWLSYYDYLDEAYYDDPQDPGEKATEKELKNFNAEKLKKTELRKARDSNRANLDKAYGKSKDTDLPIKDQQRMTSVEDHIRDHFTKSEDEKRSQIEAATRRLAVAHGLLHDVNVNLNERQLKKLHGKLKDKLYTANKKLATIQGEGVVDRNGRRVSNTLGATGMASGNYHQHGNKESWVSTCKKQTDACGGAKGQRKGLCLAQQGTYNFTKNYAKQDLDSQIQHDSRRTDADHGHGEGHSPHLDYHLLATHHAIEDAKKAKSKGESIAVRTNVTDESKDALNNVLHKIKKGEIKTDDETKDSAHHHMMLFNYGKEHQTTIHDPEHNVYTIASDTGPIHKNGKLTTSNRTRERELRNATSGDNPRNQYVIVGGRSKSGSAVDSEGQGFLLKYQKTAGRKSKLTPEKKADLANAQKFRDDTIKNIKTVRRYDLHAEPHEGDHLEGHSQAEGEDRYHHPHGHGYVVKEINGKPHRIHYQDYNVPLHGHKHDARFDPREYDPKHIGNNKDRFGRRVGAAVVNSPTAATPGEKVEHGEMFHDVNDIKHEEADQHGRTGVLEVNHPNRVASSIDTLGRNHDYTTQPKTLSQTNREKKKIPIKVA